jgi:methyltransferase (TIGR00027 family)
MATALIRSHHSRCDPEPLIVDPWGERLVPEAFKQGLAERATQGAEGQSPADRAAAVDRYLASIPSYASVVLRTRYAENELEKAVRAGVGQYVSVGAGFDSFSLRRPLFAQSLQVIEIDHPATQSVKRRQLAALGLPEPPSTCFVAADLAQENLATALRRSPFRFAERAFFSWLGVTIYLTREANSQALRAFARCGGRGSLVVFTYTDEKVFDPRTGSEGFRRLRANAEKLGEPFITGFRPAEMATYLDSLGLELLEDLDGVQLAQRYANKSATLRVMAPDSHVVLARGAA